MVNLKFFVSLSMCILRSLSVRNDYRLTVARQRITCHVSFKLNSEQFVTKSVLFYPKCFAIFLKSAC